MSSRPKGFGKTTGDYHRPRRPSAETIRYLRSLPLDLSTSLDEIRWFLNNAEQTNNSKSSTISTTAAGPLEYPASMAAALSALDEVCNELASLAGDEHASEALELLVRITAPFSAVAARKLVTACAGYAVFLSRHRYGSHVLQTILQFSVVAETSASKLQDLALHDEAPVLGGVNELPSLSEALLVLHTELMPHVSSLAVHVCGSHILRTLCCILGGFQPKADHEIAHRRGGKSKGKKKTNNDKTATSLSTAATDPQLVLILHSRLREEKNENDSNNNVITEALEELTAAISGSEVQPPGALQQLACDASASPLLMMLLRVWTYRDDRNMSTSKKKSDETTAAATAAATTHMQENGPNPDHHLVLVPREPHFREGSPAEALAHRLLCWQPKKGPTAQSHAGNVIYGLAGEPRGSHILDTLFRLSPDTLYESILVAGDFVSTKSILPEYMEHDVSNFVVQTMLATVRNTEQALKLSNLLQPNTLLILDAQKRRRGILWRWAEMAVQYPECQDKVIEGLSSALGKLQTNAKLSKQCAMVLLGMKDSPDDDRLVLNVEGTRALHHLLRFKEKAAQGIVESVLTLSSTDLERLAKDGLGSRCVWDSLLEERPSLTSVHKKLLTKLNGRWVALATDRVGHHVVRKLFLILPDSFRETLVKELSQGRSRLEGNSMGRKIAALCKLREYDTRGKNEWERSVGKTFKEKEWLEEMLHSEPSKSEKSRKSEIISGREEGRKRELSGSGIDEGAPEKSRRIREMSMGDIMSAISMPKKK